MPFVRVTGPRMTSAEATFQRLRYGQYLPPRTTAATRAALSRFAPSGASRATGRGPRGFPAPVPFEQLFPSRSLTPAAVPPPPAPVPEEELPLEEAVPVAAWQQVLLGG